MCGRFTYRLTWEEIVRLYGLTLDIGRRRNLQPRYNVCPTTDIDTVISRRGRRELMTMRWGLVPFWWNKPLEELRAATFNARAETVMTKPFFREPFQRSRCLIPVSGYYEWQDTPNGKQPWYFTRRDGAPSLTIAGLWDEWKNRETGELLRSCAMVITEPNDLVAEVYDRMPVLLDEKDFKPWLNCDAGVELLKPAPNDLLQKWPVSRRVNSSLADDSDMTLVDRIELADPALPLAGRLLI
jgi:putative SOS response-associated peptidase YedK